MNVVESLVNEPDSEEKPLLLASLSREEIHELCRSCLTKGVFGNIFRWTATDQSDGPNLGFVQLYKLLMDIEVRADDDLPKNLCDKCSEELIRFHSFRNNCHKSERILRSVISATFDTKPLLVKSEDEEVSPQETLEKSDCSKDADKKNDNDSTGGGNEEKGQVLQEDSECVSVKNEIFTEELEDDVGNVSGPCEIDRDDTPISDRLKYSENPSENLSRAKSTPSRHPETYDITYVPVSRNTSLTICPESTLGQDPEIPESCYTGQSLNPKRKQDPETCDSSNLEISERQILTVEVPDTSDNIYMKLSRSLISLQDAETCDSDYMELSRSPTPKHDAETFDNGCMKISSGPTLLQDYETHDSNYLKTGRSSGPTQDSETCDNDYMELSRSPTPKHDAETFDNSCMKISISPTPLQDAETHDSNYLKTGRSSGPTQDPVTCDNDYMELSRSPSPTHGAETFDNGCMKISISPTILQDGENQDSNYLETGRSSGPTQDSETCDNDHMELSRSPSPTNDAETFDNSCMKISISPTLLQDAETQDSNYLKTGRSSGPTQDSETCDNELSRSQTPTQDAETCESTLAKPTENLPVKVIPVSTSIRSTDKGDKDKGDSRGGRKHHCLFCGLFVSHFCRHIQRHHRGETRVQNIMALKKQSQERKKLIDQLRHEGDFCSAKVVPVRHEVHPGPGSIICKFCSGYYAQKNLNRHAKKCYFNPDPSARFNALTEGQTIMAGGFGPNDPLNACGLLSIMRADDISLVAKKDPVICEVGRKYLRGRKHKHHLAVAKTQMRRLARLVMSAREILGNEDLELSDLLSPAEFKTLIAATHEISEYDDVTRTYRSPSLALHMRSLIKNAINAAQSFELHNKRRSSPRRLRTLASLNRLMDTKWSQEVPCDVGQNFALDTFDKPTLISVAEDIMKLRTHLRELIVTSKTRLEENSSDSEAYRDLVDASFCGVMIFNTSRVGELQAMTVETFTGNSNVPTSLDFEENSLTLAEKILCKSLKRVMVSGKPGTNIPVLFDRTTTEAIELSISLRENFSLRDNSFLFGLPGSNSPISGHTAMRKLCRRALGDRSRAALLTSTEFRKHLATMAQILSMQQNELEQLALFMGHSEETRSEFFRLPDDIHETAKLSKLLLLAQSGRIDKYKGKLLKDIEIDDEIKEDDEEPADVEEDTGPGIGSATETQQQDEVLKEPVGAKGVLPRKRKKRPHISWTYEQKKLTEEFFETHIKRKKPPKKHEVMELIQEHPKVFHNKSWPVVKVYVCNTYNKK